MANAHDLAFRGPGIHHKIRVFESFFLDNKTVVASGFERIGKSSEYAGIIMMDGGGFAMHDGLGTHHLPTERLTDGLMAKAHAKHRHHARETCSYTSDS